MYYSIQEYPVQLVYDVDFFLNGWEIYLLGCYFNAIPIPNLMSIYEIMRFMMHFFRNAHQAMHAFEEYAQLKLHVILKNINKHA